MDIAVDFDGTCVSDEFPLVGNDIGAIPVLKKLIKNGHNIILNTMRGNGKLINGETNYYLTDAVNWFFANGITLYGINTHPTQLEWTKSPKVYADLYLDDRGFGVPLKLDENISEKPFFDWEKFEKYCIKNKLI